MRQIAFTAGAARQWASLDASVRSRIDAKLEAFAISGKGDVKRLRGRAGSRLRIGDWRVVFFEEASRVVVVAVGHRREIDD